MEVTGTEVIGIITAITALIGTSGGLIISYRTLQRSYWTKNIRIKVSGQEAIVGDAEGEQFVFKVANLGERNFTISMLSIRIGRRTSNLVVLKPQGFDIPYELEPGKTANYWLPISGIKKDIKNSTRRSHIKLYAEVHDYLGSTFTSKPHMYVIRQTRFDKIVKKIRVIKHKILMFIWP